MKGKMRSLVVVERHVPFDGGLIDSWFLLQVVQTFFLDCSIEAFEVRIVVWSPNSRVSVHREYSFGEPLREFATMVALERLELKRGKTLRLLHEPERRFRIRISVGDHVRVQFSPYDLTKGRIIKRM